jgi:hypothetical protein
MDWAARRISFDYERQTMSEVIQFPAQIIKVQTMQDGAIRLTLDLPETQIETARLLMECRARGGLLEIAAVAIDQVVTVKQQENNAISKRPNGKSAWQTEERPGADIPA